MTDHLSNAADDSAATKADERPGATPEATTKPAEPTRPAMAQPTAMDHEAGFTSGR